MSWLDPRAAADYNGGMAARVEQLFLRPSAATPVRAVDRANAIAERGLEGDHCEGGRRQITLLSLEAWRQVCAELGNEVDPAVRRANVVVTGVDLEQSRGRRLALGDVEVEIGGETRPCELLDRAQAGLSGALRTRWRGGVFGRIVRGAVLRVGDAVRWVDGGATPAAD